MINLTIQTSIPTKSTMLIKNIISILFNVIYLKIPPYSSLNNLYIMFFRIMETNPKRFVTYVSRLCWEALCLKQNVCIDKKNVNQVSNQKLLNDSTIWCLLSTATRTKLWVAFRVARPTYLISILLILAKICLLLIHH